MCYLKLYKTNLNYNFVHSQDFQWIGSKIISCCLKEYWINFQKHDHVYCLPGETLNLFIEHNMHSTRLEVRELFLLPSQDVRFITILHIISYIPNLWFVQIYNQYAIALHYKVRIF